ncbi:MAG: methionine adenosyltransferase domain-containing protein, partial [Parachlamydiaceae bacterium]
GKDPTKVDRSAAYFARYLAKQIVAANVSYACEIQIAYAIGLKEPVALRVNTFGEAEDRKLEEIIRKNFDLSPRGIISYLDLRRPIYQKTAFGGHFGRNDVPWEKIDRTDLFSKSMLRS